MTDDLPLHFGLFKLAFDLQLLACGLFLAYAFSPRKGLARAGLLALGLALLSHAVFTASNGLAQGRLPLASGFEALSAWGLMLTALVVWVEWRHKVGLLGAFLAPLSAATLLMGFRFIKAAGLPTMGLSDAWLLWHVALVMLSYACFTAAAGAAGATLVQDHQLKAKRLDALFYELPSLQDLEALTAELCAWGLGALLLGQGAGFIWRASYAASQGLADPKVAFSLAMALGYGLTLLLRRRGLLRGRRFALLVLVLFLLLFFGYYLVNLYFGGHAYLRPAGV